MPLVSVLMAVFNGANYLPDAIESVLSQEMADLELVIGDNASTDATADVIHEYASRDPRIRNFRNASNVGATANFNLCHHNSDRSSKYWAFLASDDWWKPSFLRTMVEASDENPSATFVHADMYRTDDAGNILNLYSDVHKDHAPPGLHRAVRELFHGCYINIMAAIVDRKKQEEIYPVEDILDPDLALTPDYHFWLQLLNRGATAYYVPKALAYYRKHDGAMTMPANTIARLRDEIVVLRDKLEGVCSPEMEETRLQALQVRLAQLGFELLKAGEADEAMSPLRAAVELRSQHRLDLPIARAISSLPFSASRRAQLWNVALAASRALGRS